MNGLAAALAATVLLAGAPAQAGPPCTVHTIDGRTLQGQVRLGDDGKVRVVGADGAATDLQLGDLLQIDQSASVPPGPPWRGSEVWLRSGMRLPIVRLQGRRDAEREQTTVTLELPSGISVPVMLTQIRALRLCSEADAPPVFRSDLHEPKETNDILLVERDGKSLRSSGNIGWLDGGKLQFEMLGRGYEVDLGTVRGVVFGRSTGFAPDRQPKPRASAVLKTGEHLEGRLLGLDASCRLRLDEGAVLELPRDQIVRIELVSDKLTWLSDLKPQVEQVPAFDRQWPWSADATPFGPGLRLHGKDYERGLCMVPRTRLTYDLGGRYDVFEAMVGIDDRGGPQANAVFRVLADGNTLFESEPMTLGLAPVALKLPLHACKQLVLEADFGKNYDLGDLCVFANARVVQQ